MDELFYNTTDERNDLELIVDDYVSFDHIREQKNIHLPEDVHLPVYETDIGDLDRIFESYGDILRKNGGQPGNYPENPRVLGREVGDDRVDISDSLEASALILTVQESVLGMRTSEEDTGITNDTWNFCEVTAGVPSSRSLLFNYARKNNDFRKMDFVDSPPLRCIVDVTKVARIHSTSYIGKSSILGAKRRSANDTCSSYLSVANLFQDACLAVWKGPEPKYLPSALGGCHCPDAYDDPVNTFLFMKAFRGGGYDRLYGTAVEEAIVAINRTENGIPTACLLAEVLRDNDTYYFATFDNLVMIPDQDKILDKEVGMPAPIYEEAGVRNEIAAVESRLVQAKRLLPKTQAIVEANRSKRIRSHLLSRVDILRDKEREKEKSLLKRAQFSNALRGNTAYMRLVERTGSMDDITKLFREHWKTCVSGQPEFTMEHARWLSNGAKGNTLNIFDIPRTSDMYLRSEVSLEESLKVGGIRLNVRGKEGFIPQVTKTKVGLYEISSSMEEWCDDKVRQLILKRDELKRPLTRSETLPIFSQDREWINDDTLIIADVIESTKCLSENTQVVLVSNDRRLGKQMGRQANVRVILVSPESLIAAMPHRTWSSTSEVTPNEIFEVFPRAERLRGTLQKPIKVYIDTGSLLSACSKFERVKVRAEQADKLVQYELITSGNRRGYRYEKVKKTTLTFKTAVDAVKLPRHSTPYTKKRQAVGRDTMSVSNISWRQQETLEFSSRVTRRGKRGGASTRSAPA